MYWGEGTCEGYCKSRDELCQNNAYYQHIKTKKYLCGVHCRKCDRQELEKNPQAAENREKLLQERERKVEKTAAKNRKKGQHGTIITSKLKMMKEPEHVDGFQKVFPNFKHGGRKDGFGCPALSPKAMGPIEHGIKDLPVALNLENFHQGNKVFPSEVDKDENPTRKFYKMQREMYADPVPYRHKEAAGSATGKNKNVPLYSFWNGKRFTYIESRQFYCNYYERIAKKLPEFKQLKKMLKEGYNLQIVGYDAYPVSKTIEEHYLDPSKPFGHEMVLYTLLVEKDKQKYPWRIHKTEKF